MSAADSAAVDASGGASENDRRSAILDAAQSVFSHYGFRRASLDEIAREAGLSRTAVYHYFRNKEDVFRAMAERLHERSLAGVERAIGETEEASERLLGALLARHGRIYSQLHASRHGLELLEESTRLADDIVKRAGERYVKLLAKVFREADRAGEISLREIGFTAERAARFVLRCADGLRGSPLPTSDVFRQRLEQLVRVVVAGLRNGHQEQQA